MGLTQMRDELHQFINQADERMLKLIYGMMKADIEEENFALTELHKQILDERLMAHENSPEEGSTWEEVKNRIKQSA